MLLATCFDIERLILSTARFRSGDIKAKNSRARTKKSRVQKYGARRQRSRRGIDAFSRSELGGGAGIAMLEGWVNAPITRHTNNSAVATEEMCCDTFNAGKSEMKTSKASTQITSGSISHGKNIEPMAELMKTMLASRAMMAFFDMISSLV
jgi:hypothetical protein